MNLNKPNLVHVGSGPLTVTLQYEGGELAEQRQYFLLGNCLILHLLSPKLTIRIVFPYSNMLLFIYTYIF